MAVQPGRKPRRPVFSHKAHLDLDQTVYQGSGCTLYSILSAQLHKSYVITAKVYVNILKFKKFWDFVYRGRHSALECLKSKKEAMTRNWYNQNQNPTLETKNVK